MHAIEVKQAIKNCFDCWVEEVLLPKFQKSFGRPITVWAVEFELLHKNGYGTKRVLHEAQARGFVIKFWDENSPLWGKYDFHSVNTIKGVPIFVSM